MNESNKASWTRRLAAGIVDVAFVALLVAFIGGGKGDEIQEVSLRHLYNLINMGVFFALLWIYFTIFEGYRGQTLGKILFKSRVVKTDQSEMRYDDALIRNFSKTVILPPVLLIFDWLFGLRKEGYLRYLDWYTKTTVIRE